MSDVNRSDFRAWEFICRYNKMMFVWDEAKRESNLQKHGLDFRDAHLVFDHPQKFTYSAMRFGEARWLDLAVVEIHGSMLALIYTKRKDSSGTEWVRVISFRPASREEREQYERDTE